MMLGKTGAQKTYTILTSDVPICRRIMNGVWAGFQSRVVSVKDNGLTSEITVCTRGKFPFVTNRWNKYILPETLGNVPPQAAPNSPGEPAPAVPCVLSFASLPRENTYCKQPLNGLNQPIGKTPHIDRLEKELNEVAKKRKRGRPKK
jgi:hypothetical protein